MKFEAWYLSDQGLRRDSNQDACSITYNLGLFIVADGMGGHSGGEVASSLAVETVQKVFKEFDGKSVPPRDVLTKAYEAASQKIYDRAAKESPELAGMGTTMVVACVRDNSIYVGNVGDSRCYLFKKPYLWQITEDHSLLNEQLRAGLLSEDQAKNFVGRNVITRSVGYEREVHPDILERQVEADEIYLICSDGLSGLVTDEKIGQILCNNPPEDIARVCVDQALANGGDDNVTVMVIHFLK